MRVSWQFRLIAWLATLLYYLLYPIFYVLDRRESA